MILNTGQYREYFTTHVCFDSIICPQSDENKTLNLCSNYNRESKISKTALNFTSERGAGFGDETGDQVTGKIHRRPRSGLTAATTYD